MDSVCVDLNTVTLLVHVWCLKIHVWHATNKCVMAMVNVCVACEGLYKGPTCEDHPYNY